MEKNKKGFTLIELIISLSILSMVLALVYSLFISSQKNVNKTEVKSELQHQAQEILNYINKSGMQARAIQQIQGSGDLIHVNTPDESVNSITLVNDADTYGFKLNNLDASTNTYDLYYNEQPAGIDKKIGSNVKDIRISIINGDALTNYGNCSAIKITIFLSKKGMDNEVYNYDVTTNVYFRNN